MSDSYYELIDDADPLGEKFTATDLVRSTWTAAIQHAAPVSALLVRALERCAQRDDTRLSRVVDRSAGARPCRGRLLGPLHAGTAGKQIELVSAEMLGPGPDGRPRARRQSQRLAVAQTDTTGPGARARTALQPVSEADSRESERELGPQLRAQPGLAMADRTGERGTRASPGSSRR